jgi:hypothetical protein
MARIAVPFMSAILSEAEVGRVGITHEKLIKVSVGRRTSFFGLG